MKNNTLTRLIIWRMFLFVLMWLAVYILPFRASYTPFYQLKTTLPYWIGVWANFDGYHYLTIAERGYTLTQLPFFPLFPIMIRLVHELIKIPYIISGQIVSTIAFVTSLFVINKLLVIDKHEKLIPLFLSLVLFFPTSFYYVAVYNDALFLLLSVLTIYFGRKQRWVLSGTFGFFATLTRLNGLALFFFIISEYAIKHKNKVFDIKNIFKSKIYSVLFIPLAFFSFLAYIQVAFGKWDLIFTAMKQWRQDRTVIPLQVFWRYYKIIFLHPTFQITYWVAVIELLAVILYLFLIVFSFRKIRFSYWIFLVLSILIPSLTGTFQGMPRYGLHLYPFFLALTLFLEKKSLIYKTMYFLICLVLLFYCLALFTRGFFIA